jgi:hypothetical protein
MKIFKDRDHKQEVSELDLGIVKAGDSKKYLFFLYNDTKANLVDVVVAINHKEVKIVESPKIIDAEKSGELVIEWKPSITLKEGLKTQLEINATELWS